MSTNHHSDPSRPDRDTVGDQNIESLLTNAYQPEALDPGFVERVRQRAHVEAQRRHVSVGKRTLLRATRLWQQRPWQMLAAMAAVILLTFTAYRAVYNHEQDTVEFYRDGNYVWVDGQPFARTAPAATGEKERTRPVAPTLQPVSYHNTAAPIDARGLVPRKRSTAAPLQQLTTGETLTTGERERKHVILPDGSQLFVNANATLKVDSDRHITVTEGEIYVAVAPVSDDDQRPTFVVNTPDHDVTAWGTKFAVQVEGTETKVLVTQGKVQVSGVDSMILAGQQLHLDPADQGNAATIAPLPQASYALDWMRDLVVAAESPLVPSSEFDGGALVAIDPSGQQMKLSLRKQHIDVHLEDGFARTTIDQTYFNHSSNRLEGTFYFPLPADASISRLAMYVNGRLMEGGMAEREHARNVFETIKHRSLDPALLEWIDGSTFKMRVFPLEGRQEKRIVLSYTQKLANHYGDTQYRFPAGHNIDTISKRSVNIHVIGGAAWKWKCSSHQLTAVTKDEDLTLTSSSNNASSDRDLVITLSDELSGGAQPAQRARFSTVRYEGSQYLMVRWRPELPTVAQQARRDWVFLLDSDGSRDPLLARVQVDIVRKLLENAGHDDTFSIITAGTRIHAFAAEQQPVSPANVAAAVEFLDTTHLIGALDLRQALIAARGFTQAVTAPTLVHVGAGVPVLGERDTSKLLGELPPEVPYVGAAVGKRWNRQLMKEAALRSGGYFTQINPDESVAWRTLELLSTLNTPRLTSIQIAADKEQCKFLVVNDSIAHGEELCAITRQADNEDAIQSITVTGQVGGEPLRQTIAAEQPAEGANYLPRMWAKLEIDRLVAADAQANKAAIIELSKSMYVMSPFTSLLVLENDAMYDQYNVDRGRKDHWALYPCPEKIDVVQEPTTVPPPSDSTGGATPTAKPSPAEVLRTLLIYTPQGPVPITASRWATGSHFVPGQNIRLWGDARGEGIPQLNYLPYSGRLFRDESLIRQQVPIMMMVTPRIIIQEEETPWGFQRAEPFEMDYEGFEFAQQKTGFMDSDFDSMRDWTTSIGPREVWDTVGGQGLIRGFSSDLSLVISQTQSLHDAREQLLTELYSVADLVPPRFDPTTADFKSMQFDSLDFTVPQVERMAEKFITDADPKGWNSIRSLRFGRPFVGQTRSNATANDPIRSKLDIRSKFNHHDVTLHTILDDLRTRFEIPIVLRPEAIEPNGSIVDDKRLNFSANDITVRSALTLILDKLGLTYYLEAGTVQITTANGFQQHLALRSRWLDETLLLLDRSNSMPPVEATESGDNDRQSDAWSRRQLARLLHNQPDPQLLYPTLRSSSDPLTFRNLVAFAPGITTTMADIAAVLDAEAELKNRPQIGSIDPDAKALINAARNADWHVVVRPDLQITVDGQGRFRYDRKTEYGLSETVICNGSTLRHIYPELGLGTTRTMSRFHRQQLTQLVPWFLPPVEDLAAGADVRLVGPDTVAIVPLRAGVTEEEQSQPVRDVRIHLQFASDGRLAERQLVEMPSGDIKAKIVFTPSGPVQWLDGQNKLIHETQLSATACSEPDLSPQTDQLVILPMPVRDRGHILTTVRSEHGEPSAAESETDALKKLVRNQQQKKQDDPLHWNEDDVLRLVAACLWQNPAELRSIIGRRFFAHGDRRIGFYTLLLSSGDVWSLKTPVQLSDNTTTLMNPVKDHPHSRLASYVQRELEAAQNKPADTRAQTPLDTNSFIEQMAEYRQLCAEWSLARPLSADVEVRRRSLDQLFDFVSRCDSPHSAYVLLRRVQRRLGNDQPTGRIAEALIQLEQKGVSSYVVKYELARSLTAQGQQQSARDLFIDLYCETLAAGLLPPVDKEFCEAIQNSDVNPFGDGKLPEKGLPGFLRAVCDQLVQQNQRPLAIALSWQCRQLGQDALAERLFDQALAGVDEEQLTTRLSALNYLILARDYDRFLQMIDPLLTHADYNQSSSLWRLAAHVAEEAGRLAQAARYTEKALDLEYDNLPQRYNAEEVRRRYQQLFGQYQQLAKSTTIASEAPPAEFVSRLIQAADRWRALDSDVTPPCQQASQLLASIGLHELAWDYLTTPLAMKPNEAAAWLTLAQQLRSEKSYELAGRAYAAAYEAEPTNAQILWDHAQTLEQAGRSHDAQTLYEQIAKGQWQPRFESLQRRAQRIYEDRTADN